MIREYTYDLIAELYRSGGITDAQLDGTGAPEGSQTMNFVSKLGWFTQAQADAIRAGAIDPAVTDLQAKLDTQQQINDIITGGATA